MAETVITIIISVHVTIPKGSVKGLEIRKQKDKYKR